MELPIFPWMMTNHMMSWPPNSCNCKTNHMFALTITIHYLWRLLHLNRCCAGRDDWFPHKKIGKCIGEKSIGFHSSDLWWCTWKSFCWTDCNHYSTSPRGLQLLAMQLCILADIHILMSKFHYKLTDQIASFFGNTDQASKMNRPDL